MYWLSLYYYDRNASWHKHDNASIESTILNSVGPILKLPAPTVMSEWIVWTGGQGLKLHNGNVATKSPCVDNRLEY